MEQQTQGTRKRNRERDDVRPCGALARGYRKTPHENLFVTAYVAIIAACRRAHALAFDSNAPFGPAPNALSPASTAALKSGWETPSIFGRWLSKHDAGSKSNRASLVENVPSGALQTRRFRRDALSSSLLCPPGEQERKGIERERGERKRGMTRGGLMRKIAREQREGGGVGGVERSRGRAIERPSDRTTERSSDRAIELSRDRETERPRESLGDE